MGQWIVIQGASPAETAALSQRAAHAFSTLHHLEPYDQVADGAAHAYTYAPQFSSGLAIERNQDSGEWAGAAGPLFYEDWGKQEALRNFLRADLERAVHRLDGAFALFRRAGNGQMAVITDRLGGMHVYAASVGSASVITTSSLVLAALGNANWNPDSCREFLATGTVYGQRTLFQGIEKLAPGCIYRFADGRLQSKTSYWRIADFEYSHLHPSETTQRLGSALERVIRNIAASYPRPVLDLTGGLDTRVLLGAALWAGVQFETTVAGTTLDPDVQISAEIARAYRISHHPIPPSDEIAIDGARAALPLTDGEQDLFEYARIARIHSSLAKNHDASVNGSNGEIFRGHWWPLLFPFTGSRRWFPTGLVAARCFAPGQEAGLLATVFPCDLKAHFGALMNEANQPLRHRPNTAQMDNLYLMLRMQRWQGRIATSTNRLWPALSPFAFREPLELALTSRPAIRKRSRLSRRLMEHFDPKLAALPLAAKRGRPSAVPLSNNLRIWNEIRDLLLARNAVTQALYRPDALSALIDRASGAAVPGTAAARAVTLELLAQVLKEFRTS